MYIHMHAAYFAPPIYMCVSVCLCVYEVHPNTYWAWPMVTAS